MAELGWRSRLAIALAVPALGPRVRHCGAGMDERFSHASRGGPEGLLRYTVGDYAGAARAYRAHYATGYEPLPSLWPAPTPAKRSGGKPPDVQALLTEGEAAFTRNDLDAAGKVYEPVPAVPTDQYAPLLLISVLETTRG